MTAILGANPSPLAPILAMLDAVRARRTAPGEAAEALGLADGLVIGDAGRPWVPATEFTDGTATARLLAGPRLRWHAPPHAAAALAWKAYTYWLALPAVVGFAAARRVPLLPASNTLVRLSMDRPYMTFGMRRLAVAALPNDPIAGTPGVRLVPDEEALLDVLRTTLVDEHLAPLLAEIRRHVNVGRRTLWGSLASGVAHAVNQATAALVPGTAAPTADRLNHALGVPDLVDLTETPSGELDVQRRTCCLAFTVPGLKICTGCCIK